MPNREYLLIFAVLGALGMSLFVSPDHPVIWIVALVSGIPTLLRTISATRARRITIDSFNAFAIVVSVATGDPRTVLFIGLMLAFARLLDWRTETRTTDAVKELLKLKPLIASIEVGDEVRDVPIDAVERDAIVVVRPGARIPVDGRIVYGTSHVNESSVTGESALVHKVVGDAVLSGTLNESGAIKVRAERVGADSTIERMAALVRDAAKNKSRAERIADRFAVIFLPVVAGLGAATYLITRDIQMTAALFLVACADDMAIAIPLAMTASLGAAAKRGVIVRGGEWLDVLAKTRIIVLDKTGTLTYGRLAVHDAHIEPGTDETVFWACVAGAEKFSEHPVGKAIYRHAAAKFRQIPDPIEFQIEQGAGVRARVDGHRVAIGNDLVVTSTGTTLSDGGRRKLQEEREEHGQTSSAVIIDDAFAGLVTVADVPREEAARSLRRLKDDGIRVIMMTGDTEKTAAAIARSTGITDVRSSMTPEKKLRELEGLLADGPVAMVGDGVNDAPALARADIGIAMGGTGTAVAIEAANVIILSDDLTRLPETVALARRTMGVIRSDTAIWAASNLLGFALVFTGIAGPAIAAFYNLATDFFPLLNSARLFRKR